MRDDLLLSLLLGALLTLSLTPLNEVWADDDSSDEDEDQDEGGDEDDGGEDDGSNEDDSSYISKDDEDDVESWSDEAEVEP